MLLTRDDMLSVKSDARLAGRRKFRGNFSQGSDNFMVFSLFGKIQFENCKNSMRFQLNLILKVIYILSLLSGLRFFN